MFHTYFVIKNSNDNVLAVTSLTQYQFWANTDEVRFSNYNIRKFATKRMAQLAIEAHELKDCRIVKVFNR